MKSLLKHCLLILPCFLSAKPLYVPYEKAFCAKEYPANKIGSWYQSFYETYHHAYLEEKDYLIPPIIHFIWLGSSLPFTAQKMIETWREHHPGWIIKIWTDADVEPFGLRNKQAFDKSANFGQKSDIFRYEILYRFGGVYVDIDFECLQPFDSLHQSCEFYAGISQENNSLYNGLIGVKRQHPIMKACIDHLEITEPFSYAGNLFCALQILHQSGPHYFTNIFSLAAPACEAKKIALLPPTVAYPIPASFAGMITDEVKQQYIRPETLCIHHWGCSWAPDL